MDKTPFKEITPFYDALMSDVKYEKWVSYVISLFNFLSVKPKKILDIACGTGTPTILLAKKGFSLIGIDNSLRMLKIAIEKTQRERLNIPFIAMDIRNFHFLNPLVEAVVSFFDSLNYLTDKEELSRCFKCTFSALKPSGIFIFDMNTRFALSEIWGNKTTVKEVNNIFSVWRNHWEPEKSISTLRITLFVENKKGFYRIEEVHRERAYPVEDVINLLKVVGFKEIEVFEHGSFKSPHNLTPRVMFTARKV